MIALKSRVSEVDPEAVTRAVKRLYGLYRIVTVRGSRSHSAAFTAVHREISRIHPQILTVRLYRLPKGSNYAELKFSSDGIHEGLAIPKALGHQISRAKGCLWEGRECAAIHPSAESVLFFPIGLMTEPEGFRTFIGFASRTALKNAYLKRYLATVAHIVQLGLSEALLQDDIEDEVRLRLKLERIVVAGEFRELVQQIIRNKALPLLIQAGKAVASQEKKRFETLTKLIKAGHGLIQEVNHLAERLPILSRTSSPSVFTHTALKHLDARLELLAEGIALHETDKSLAGRMNVTERHVLNIKNDLMRAFGVPEELDNISLSRETRYALLEALCVCRRCLKGSGSEFRAAHED